LKDLTEGLVSFLPLILIVALLWVVFRARAKRSNRSETSSKESSDALFKQGESKLQSGDVASAKSPDENEPVKEFRQLLFREFGELAFHHVMFSNEEEALAFYNDLSFVSNRNEGEILGMCPDNMMMRVVRYSDGVEIMIAGHLTSEQNYEILYETQRRLRTGRLKRTPQHYVAVKSREHFVAKAFNAASQKLTKEHPEFFVKK
jgi:hypothetical protein